MSNSIFDIDNKEAPVSNSFLLTGFSLIETETLISRLKLDIYIPFLLKHLRGTDLLKSLFFMLTILIRSR